MLVVACALGVGAWTALAQTLATTTSPLSGSTFQGADGNQDNPNPNPDLLVDWQALQSDGRVDHTSDPNDPDNVFAGGDKTLQPDGWGFTTQNGGANPKGANILDIYRAVGPPPPGGGDAFLYLALVREASSGSQSLTLELNQDATKWKNSTGTLIPCRKTGDILISFQQHGNGVSVQVDRWVTAHADAVTGCATDGHLDSASGLTPNVDVQGSWNNSDIHNYLPPLSTTTLDAITFGEAAINLSKWLSVIGEPCGVVASTWAHSRASDEVESDMKDYVVPSSFRVPVKGCPVLVSSASGKVNRKARGKHRLRRHKVLRTSAMIQDTATLSGGDSPTGTITFNLYGPGDASCSKTPVSTSSRTVNGNGSYQSVSYTPLAAGTYRWVVQYSGDDNNHGAGPTNCGDPTETVEVSKARPTLTSTASGPTHLRRIGVGPRRRHRFRTARVHTTRAAQPFYDSADLEGGLAPAGTITFKLYGPSDPNCSGDPIIRPQHVTVSGNGKYNSDPFTPVHAGTYRWVVDYSGDDNNKPAGPTGCGETSETVVVSPASPTVVTVASPAVEVNRPITDIATLSGGAAPIGTITFKLFGPGNSDCSGTAIFTSKVDVHGNNAYKSGEFTPTTKGTYRWIAVYSGDSDNNGVSTSCGDPGEQVVVAPPPPVQPTLTTTASPGTPAGSLIDDTAHLSGGSDPSGSITFQVFGPNNDTCADPPAQILSVTVTGNGDYTSPPFRPTEAGTYHWIASYSGDEANKSATTACSDTTETVTVSKAQPTIRTFAFPIVPIGLLVQDRALLTGASKPTGIVTFRLFGPDDSTCLHPVYTSHQTVSGNGLYPSQKFFPVRAGTYRWIATYSGDANNLPVATTCGDRGESARVLPRRPLLTTSASPPANVRKGPRAQAAGKSIYDSARLRSGFFPIGHITFELFGPNNPTCSGDPIFTSAVKVTGNGVYNSESFIPTASGIYHWVATYSGDGNNRPVGPTGCRHFNEHVRVLIPAVPLLTSSASEAVTLGGAIHDTAHLSQGAVPTGRITFKLFGPNDTDCSGDPLFASTAKVAGNGDYLSGSFVPTKAGAYQWVVEYSGDHRNHGAGPTACDDATETAVARPPSITPVTPTFSTTATPSPGLGAPIDDVAHLGGGVSPFGTITFSLFGPDNATCSGPPAFTSTVAVDGNGDYRSDPFVAPLAGTYRWVVTYSGDAMNNGAAPTTCGDSAETATVSASVSPDVTSQGPNVPTPPKPKPKPKPHKPKPKPRPPQPIVTG